MAVRTRDFWSSEKRRHTSIALLPCHLFCRVGLHVIFVFHLLVAHWVMSGILSIDSSERFGPRVAYPFLWPNFACMEPVECIAEVWRGANEQLLRSCGRHCVSEPNDTQLGRNQCRSIAPSQDEKGREMYFRHAQLVTQTRAKQRKPACASHPHHERERRRCRRRESRKRYASAAE